jgi:pimeloyl-ACP methyl ester carboxylesterase
MNKWKLLAVGSVVAGALLVGRRAGLKEDLTWEEVDKPGRVVDIDAYGVHYVERGEGRPIVLIHGFGGHTYHYRRMIDVLAREHRVVAVDLKGFGYSERDANAGLSQTDQVRMLRTLLERLRVERAVFIGHSMGGAIVQRYVATYPEQAEAVALIASVVVSGERFRRLPVLPAPLMRPVLPLLSRIAASRLLAASFYDPAYLTDEIRSEYLRPARLKGSMDGLMAMMRDSRNDGPIDASRITAPALIIAAAQDRIVPLLAAQRIRETIPHARLVVIDRAGHGLIDERAPECSRAILDFLRETPRVNAASAASAG